MEPNKEFYVKLNELSRRVPEAIRHLRRVTGKVGFANIEPMTAKRWSERCWESFGVLIDLSRMLEFGKTPDQIFDNFLNQYRPNDSWVGKVTSGKFPTGTFECVHLKGTKAPRFRKWKLKKR